MRTNEELVEAITKEERRLARLRNALGACRGRIMSLKMEKAINNMTPEQMETMMKLVKQNYIRKEHDYEKP